MSATESPSARKNYPVATICTAWGIPRSTFYDWRTQQASPARTRSKPGPTSGRTDGELVQLIQAQLERVEREFGLRGEGHRKVHARMRHDGIVCSKRRVLRLMRENALLAPTRVGRPRGPRHHDGSIHTDRPDAMWGTDLTTTLLRSGRPVAVFIAVDHCTGECVGIHASEGANRFEALEPIRQGVRDYLGDIDAGVAAGLALRHDHGTQYTSRAFQDELAFLGIESSPSYVRSPEGNGVAERFIRVVKEQLLWIRPFDSVEELRKELQDFRTRYNQNWLVARHGHKTPAEVRRTFSPNPPPTRMAA